MSPKERERIEVLLDEKNEAEIRMAIEDIESIVRQELPPEAAKTKFCRKCAYGEFCWV